MSAALTVRLFFWIWFGAAAAAGYFVWLQRVPAAAVPGIVVGITMVPLLLYRWVAPLRAWVDGLDLRSLVLLHVTRFIGIYLLVLYQRDELPRAFAVPAGIGHIIVATIALVVALAPMEPEPRRRAIVIWNVVGFIDLLFILFSEFRIALTEPRELRALTHLPLSFLPTLLEPLILATHVIIFQRTSQPRADTRNAS